MKVEIWSDIVCPWCYIGKRRFESALARFEHADEVEVRWRSFELDRDAPAARSESAAEHLATKYGMTIEKAAASLTKMDALAAREGLAYDLAGTQGGNSFDAHRLVHLGYSHGAAAGAAVEEALFHVYFIALQPLGDRAALTAAAVDAGLDLEEASAVLDGDRFAGEVRADERLAAQFGCTGVPFFVFDRTLAVSGAQSPETLLDVLERAWARNHPVLEVVGGNEVGDEGGSTCSEDSCAI